MGRQASVVVTSCALFVAALWAAEAYAVRNNLNLIPPARTQFGLAGLQGETLRVRLFRSRADATLIYNDSQLSITDIPSGGPPLFNGTEAGLPFDDAFPNGAYELVEGNDAELLAAKGCLQGKALNNAGWDHARTYCDKASVARIKISTYGGDDLVTIDPAITVPVISRCSHAQDPCGYNCFNAGERTCCDQSSGCSLFQGQTCGVDGCVP